VPTLQQITMLGYYDGFITPRHCNSAEKRIAFYSLARKS
jgi:hypothetical protein